MGARSAIIGPGSNLIFRGSRACDEQCVCVKLAGAMQRILPGESPLRVCVKLAGAMQRIRGASALPGLESCHHPAPVVPARTGAALLRPLLPLDRPGAYLADLTGWHPEAVPKERYPAPGL